MDKYINGLRVIETLRDFHEPDINSFIDLGCQVIIKEVKPISELYITTYIFQHVETNHIKMLGSDLRQWPGNGKFVDAGYGCSRFADAGVGYELLKKIVYYPYRYRFKTPYAAYLIPADIKLNEKVFVSDLIEDYVGARHWENHRLDSSEAIWDGKELKILHSEDKVEYPIG